jgi:hypothetical protein
MVGEPMNDDVHLSIVRARGMHGVGGVSTELCCHLKPVAEQECFRLDVSRREVHGGSVHPSMLLTSLLVTCSLT